MKHPVSMRRVKSLFDLRAVCLALGFALAASLPLLTTLRERRDFYWFEVALSSTASGVTRVSWDSGHGYNERESSAQPVNANAQPLRYLYLLPTGALQGLRMTPIDRPATLQLLHARVGDLASMVRHGDGNPFAAVEPSQPESGALPRGVTGRILKAATDYRFTANSTTFTVDAPKRGLAVLTETYFPEDFQVTVNGKPTPYFRVNHAFKGVMLPEAGTYRITFAYWPKYFTLMLGLSGAGLLFAAGGGWMLWRVARPAGSAAS